MMLNTLTNLVHVAKIRTGEGSRFLFLRRSETAHYLWYQVVENNNEVATPISGDSAEEAIRLARRHWQDHEFDTLRCGFRFTLPERDEVGGNALFHQMVASYSSMNGVYMDEELGHQCIVHDASADAINLWHTFI